MANPASMAVWLSSCARTLAIYGGLFRMHTVASRIPAAVKKERIATALDAEVRCGDARSSSAGGCNKSGAEK